MGEVDVVGRRLRIARGMIVHRGIGGRLWWAWTGSDVCASPPSDAATDACRVDRERGRDHRL
jgi:hypothetical protein